jgi:hypothetical protein
LLSGRDFDARDSETSMRSTILNETMARYYFANGDAIGRTIVRRDSALTVVGVVRDVEEQDVRAHPIRRMYIPIFQAKELPREFNIEVRTAGDPSALLQAIRAAVLAAHPTLAIDIHSLNDLVSDSLGKDRLVTQVITFFGVLALVLAALGLYGVMVFTTTRRASEFGLRHGTRRKVGGCHANGRSRGIAAHDRWSRDRSSGGAWSGAAHPRDSCSRSGLSIRHRSWQP